MSPFFVSLLILFNVIFILSCATKTSSDFEKNVQLKVGEVQLMLKDFNGKCRAVFLSDHGHSTYHDLDIPWSCNFHTNNLGNVRTVEEADYIYILVESSKKVELLSSDDCETYIQSIRIKGKSVEISQHKDRVASCIPFQWDSNVFKGLFDEPSK